MFLTGGQSHMESWDMKPDAGEMKGEFDSIETNLPGLRVCEYMPYLAKQADKYAVVRNVSHSQGAHSPGQRYLQTGNRKIPSLEYPDYGAVISKEHQSPPGVPQYVLAPSGGSNSASYSSGYLGVAHGPFTALGDPNAKNYSVRALATPEGLTLQQVEARRLLLKRVNTRFANVDNQDVVGMDKSYEKAFEILQSKAVRKAFDIGSEKTEIRDQYGRHSFGQSCLLARRLVEAGTRCVSIYTGGWDTHENNFRELKGNLLPPWDQGLAALIADLHERGLLENTVVWCTGEFGRTPKINDKGAGRDHWARAMSMVFAGGGIRGGQVIGETDKTGSEPVGESFSPDDAAASFYRALGIDHLKEYHTADGRPAMIVGKGTPIEQLWG
ncbi:MAG: DUF1501 domain-containing protein [Planctomycetaceae bacterium]|nr:DUF1501 domain-containing protein [Planctomycetaceae bacterium]MBT6156287.1 DUF1501 domain-containing protein [Planctomycetaceae bacterium]MBT6484628.1 DUF1501 domain-containing protein [Planctomycetaceae bacterium]